MSTNISLPIFGEAWAFYKASTGSLFLEWLPVLFSILSSTDYEYSLWRYWREAPCWHSQHDNFWPSVLNLWWIAIPGVWRPQEKDTWKSLFIYTIPFHHESRQIHFHVIGRIRNKACNQNKCVRLSIDVTCHVQTVLRSWRKILKGEIQMCRFATLCDNDPIEWVIVIGEFR